MNTKYINISRNNPQSDIIITKENLEIIENWNKNKASLSKIQSCIFQLAFNFKDYANFMEDYSLDKIVCKIPNTNENDFIAQQYNRYLLNFTSSYVACTDYYRKICCSYGLSDQYKNLTSEYYIKYFEYRLFQKLRNFILHNAVPANIVNVTRKKLVCTKDHLLEQGNWNNDLKEDIQALPDEIELNLYVAKSIEVLMEMLDVMTCNIFNKGLDFYKSLKDFLSSINIENLNEDIIIRIESESNSLSMIYNFEKEYMFIKSIADNQNYASELFKLYIDNF